MKVILTAVNRSIVVWSLLSLCVEAALRHRSAPVTQPRASLTVWRTSWAVPVGWATATSSRLTWAPRRSAVGGETLGCERLQSWGVRRRFWESVLCVRGRAVLIVCCVFFCFSCEVGADSFSVGENRTTAATEIVSLSQRYSRPWSLSIRQNFKKCT